MRFRSTPIVRGVLSAAILPWLGGCVGTTAQFSVKAWRFHDPEPAHATYRTISANPAVSPADPTFLQVADYVRTALFTKGCREAIPGETAGMVVEIAFERDAPRVVTRVKETDVYEDVPETTETKNKKVRQPDGTVLKQKVTTTIPAHQEKVRTDVTTYAVALFPKRLTVTARDTPGTRPATKIRRLWVVEVRNEDERDEFKEYLVLMVAAAMDYLGESIDGERTFWISTDNRRTQLLLKCSEIEKE